MKLQDHSTRPLQDENAFFRARIHVLGNLANTGRTGLAAYAFQSKISFEKYSESLKHDF